MYIYDQSNKSEGEAQLHSALLFLPRPLNYIPVRSLNPFLLVLVLLHQGCKLILNDFVLAKVLKLFV